MYTDFAQIQALLRYRLYLGTGFTHATLLNTVQTLLRYRPYSGICFTQVQAFLGTVLLRDRLYSGSDLLRYSLNSCTGFAQIQALLRHRLCSGTVFVQVQALLRYRL
jgi:hypothetical protein